MWFAKGAFEAALEDDEDVIWMDNQGEKVLYFLLVSLFIFWLFPQAFMNLEQSSFWPSLGLVASTGGSVSCSVEPATRAGTPNPEEAGSGLPEAYKQHLLTELKVPKHLTVQTASTLQFAYQKIKDI